MSAGITSISSILVSIGWGCGLADVSGKGITAALLMSNVQATIRSQGRLAPDAGTCVSQSNDMLYASTDSDKFVTMFYAVLDTRNHRLEYCNAGHNPPIMIGSGGPVLLDAGGPVLGVVPEFPYEMGEVEFMPGQTLVVYSDGFSEAMNSRLEEFGDDQLRTSAEAHAGLPPAQLLNALLADVSEFCGDAAQGDDMTIMAVQRPAAAE